MDNFDNDKQTKTIVINYENLTIKSKEDDNDSNDVVIEKSSSQSLPQPLPKNPTTTIPTKLINDKPSSPLVYSSLANYDNLILSPGLHNNHHHHTHHHHLHHHRHLMHNHHHLYLSKTQSLDILDNDNQIEIDDDIIRDCDYEIDIKKDDDSSTATTTTTSSNSPSPAQTPTPSSTANSITTTTDNVPSTSATIPGAKINTDDSKTTKEISGVITKLQSLDQQRPIYPNVPYSPYGSPYGSPRTGRRRTPLRESRRISIEQSGSFLQLNQYKLMDQIGQGSYGLVKLAYSEEDSTHYAMKILSKRKLLRKVGLLARGPKRGGTGTSPLDRVYREIAVLKKVSNINI